MMRHPALERDGISAYSARWLRILLLRVTMSIWNVPASQNAKKPRLSPGLS
jgi:hypothetical protein